MRKTLLLATALCLAPAGSLHAQSVIEGTEELHFERPESWAMKYFASLALLTGMGVPEPTSAGSVELGFEGGYVPQLDEEQRRVGFEGTKVEDLNRTSFFGRVRGRVGLSESYSLELGYVPPIEIDGTTPHLFAAAIGRPFALSESWRLGLRGYGQIGTIDGDITCSAEEIETGPNDFGCEAPSEDELTQRVLGAEVAIAWIGSSAWRPYVGVAFNYLDLEFQVDARYRGIVDQTLQVTDGATVSFTGGLSYLAGDRWRVTGELFATPLSIVRPPSTTSENDGLLNARFLVSYRLR